VRKADAMELREAENLLEVSPLEMSPADSSTPGDLRLGVRVSSKGFAGSSALVWVEAISFQRLLVELRALEATRQGSARLEALGSPDEFWMEFRAIDRAGHMAVFGHLCRWEFLSTGTTGYHQSLGFGFEFCPSRLPAILAAFEKMATSVALNGKSEHLAVE
jgi:hypothetical protein